MHAGYHTLLQTPMFTTCVCVLGLRMSMQPGEPTPTLFTDPAFKRTSNWRLSTSQITSEYFTGYGWGTVTSDGYGIAYMVKENALHFNIASYYHRNDRLRAYFHEALAEMRQVFEATIPPPKSKL